MGNPAGFPDITSSAAFSLFWSSRSLVAQLYSARTQRLESKSFGQKFWLW